MPERKQAPSKGLGAPATKGFRMPAAMARMSCLICGHRWEAEAVSEDDSAYLIVDDLCPECEAQGEPTELVLPERGDRLLDENLRAGPVRPNSSS